MEQQEPSTVTLCRREAEYKGVTIDACETLWLKRVLKDLDVSINDPILIYCDNLNSIHLAQNPVFNARTKHIVVLYHFIQERVLVGMLTFNILARIFRRTTSLRKP